MSGCTVRLQCSFVHNGAFAAFSFQKVELALFLQLHGGVGCNCRNRVRTVGTTPPCNCRNKANYLLEGKCCESSIIYKATLKSNGTARHYYGCSETEFKTRFNNHKQNLVHQRKRNATELSKAVWNAKDAETNPSIE